ncbi:MAG: 1-(5-phosphoribosyl)-5-[(5-phosphoribosylamino)methylideneamino]imidazole-4-carboxamide isomerase [Armatimonadetes bacterium]|nr:1-(5-phosphoribosyl)-5-[(5-phosphoribosylamino)methylideneamino]imidazole-4-carboxamide isomerase [Armatimonadota bacterium]
MEIIPAIDIIEGRCVRLVQGKFDQQTVFSDNPVEVAVEWEREGARRLHVVDLDGARTGRPCNVKVLQEIARSVSIPIQVGGGIRALETARRVLRTGVDRVIIGTSAALDTETAQQMFGELEDAAVLGVDALNGYVAVRGWQARTEERAIDFARRMQGYGARRIIFTDISRDGMLTGVNVFAVERMLQAVDIPLIASGGVGSIEDIKRLIAIQIDNLEGVILGKALYTGAVSLAEAISAVAERV